MAAQPVSVPKTLPLLSRQGARLLQLQLWGLCLLQLQPWVARLLQLQPWASLQALWPLGSLHLPWQELLALVLPLSWALSRALWPPLRAPGLAEPLLRRTNPKRPKLPEFEPHHFALRQKSWPYHSTEDGRVDPVFAP